MDDHFLHQLRREPPTGFATRLKWQLDRPAPTRTSRARLILVFAIFGTAFALVSPQARRAFDDLYHKAVSNTHRQTDQRSLTRAPPVASAGVSGDANRRPPTPRSRTGLIVPHAPQPQSLPAERSDDPQPAAPMPQPIGGVFSGSGAVSAQNSTSQTPEQRAQATVNTRQALFKLLSLVNAPLGSMLAGHTPIDMQLARTNAHRLHELSSMIPEVFRTDTRAFDVHTLTLDLVWTQFGDFNSKADALTLAADELEGAIAAQDTTAALAAIRRIETACSACHNSYRRKP
jgi:cytochrome c556